MFKPERCDFCGRCLAECRYMDVGLETAGEWMRAMVNGERTPAVDQCLTCYACNETCPTQAGPFELIAALQEKYEALLPRDQVESTEGRYEFSGELRGVPQADRVMSVCVFGKTDPGLMEGELYDLPRVGGKPYFCWVLFSHMGGTSVQEKHARDLVDRLALTGAREVVCFHDDCYSLLASLAPEYGIDVPFRPVHLAEHLAGRLEAAGDRLRSLGRAAAYQRPCASRYTPAKEPFIDRVFELAGVRRVERAFDRENAMCCAGLKFMLNKGDPTEDQERNIEDARKAGAEALVCLCPMCLHSLSGAAGRLGMPLVFIGDLARMALGEMEINF